LIAADHFSPTVTDVMSQVRNDLFLEGSALFERLKSNEELLQGVMSSSLSETIRNQGKVQGRFTKRNVPITSVAKFSKQIPNYINGCHNISKYVIRLKKF
jgi:hypothetical protein